MAGLQGDLVTRSDDDDDDGDDAEGSTLYKWKVKKRENSFERKTNNGKFSKWSLGAT